jgi:hypothetical protein
MTKFNYTKYSIIISTAAIIISILTMLMKLGWL